jgi:nitroimidazol reductase NimA-like FMN-containing flavoprotein (pyridoxamine 5'-phosphate oxidase superfamily)
MDETLKARILDLIGRHNIMTLATVRPDGFPQATVVYYVADGLNLSFATNPSSQKAGNIKLNDKVSATIIGQAGDAYKLLALSLSGTAKRITNPTQAKDIQNQLFQAIPQAKRFAPVNSKELSVYSIKPIAISLVDYAAGYGKTALIEL